MLSIKVPTIQNKVFSTVLEVRINDINYGNHLGYDSLISFLHEARVRFLRELGYTELNVEGLGMLVTNLVTNYVSEAFYFDKIIIDIAIGDTTQTSFEIIYQAVHQATNKMIARALTTMTFYNYQKRKVVKIPQQFLSAVGLNIKPL